MSRIENPVEDFSADSRAARVFEKEVRRIVKEAYLIHRWGDGYGGFMIEKFKEIVQEEVGAPESARARYSKKKKIPYETRRKVFERDKYRCCHCGGYEDLTIDHIVPESKGGAHEIGNFQTLCRSCNSKKGVKQ